MKKILLIVGLAFGCGSVYAQNIITQTGNNNNVTPDQAGVLNPATKFKIIQTNDWNNAVITQSGPNTGVGNYTELVQTSAATPVGFMTAALKNSITVVQNGVSNQIFGTQIGFKNGAYLRQGNSTSLGTITTEQYGSRNALGIYQDAGTGNVATVKQGTSYMPSITPPAYFDGNDAMLQRNNSTELRQTGEAGQATITQSGSFGYIKAFQSGGAVAANTINIAQSNNGGVELDQAGNNNKMTATQRGFQIATLEQGATSKNGDISIVQGNAPMDQTKNDAKLRQLSGDGNKILLYQDRVGSIRNTTRITQSNDGNTATSTQEGQSSMVIATQSGAGNTAMFLQKNAAFGMGSAVTSTQTGDGGLVDIIQDGTLHKAYFTQAGAENEITVDQNGVENKATVDQVLGSFMIAKVDQREGAGNSRNNTAKITQSGTVVAGSSSTVLTGYDYTDPYNPVPVYTTTPTAGSSSGLVANIKQQGRESFGTIDQKGSSNSASITQNKPYTFESNSTITQSGQDNKANSNQLGKNQTSTIEQSAGTKNSDINVNQGVAYLFSAGYPNDPDKYSKDNVALVKQLGTGDNNEITLDQSNQSNEATLTQQNGDNNVIDVDQYPQKPGDVLPGGAPLLGNNGVGGNKTTITQQNGNGNVAKLNQEGYENGLTLTQDGSDNELGRTGGDFAQQSGHNNTATLTQTGDDLSIGLDQAGTTGTATVTQTGEENQTGIYQFSGDKNVADVTQSGGGAGSGNTIGIAQDGDNNTATVTSQSGTANEAYIGQSRDGDVAGVGNTTTVTQAGSDNGLVSAQGLSNNTNSVNQDGESNLAATVQYGQGNEATTDQALGTKNSASIILQGDFDISDPSYRAAISAAIGGGASGIASAIFNNLGIFGSIVTPGDGNIATVNQTAGDGLQATIVQAGDLNEAAATQSGMDNGTGIVQVGDDNTATVTTQSGEDNEIYIIQDRNGDELNGVGNTAKVVSQSGEDNQILIAQGMTDNTSTVTQAGEDNYAVTGQYGTTNQATITQDAGTDGGTAAILQGNFDLTAPGVAGAVLTALGSSAGSNAEVILDNLGNTSVFGTDPMTAAVTPVMGNQATINQTAGDNHIGLIGQVGNDNEAQLDQSGTQNAALLLQGGALKDIATVTQTGTTGIVILGQQGKVIAGGETMGNTAGITQAGTDNAMLVGQSGSENSAIIDQKGTDNGIVGGVLSGGIAVGQFGVKNQVTVNQDATTSSVIIGQGALGDMTGLTSPITLDKILNPDGTGLVAPVYENEAFVDQVGTENSTLVLQSGNMGIVDVDQAGTENTVFAIQVNPTSSDDAVLPISVDNKAYVTQTADVKESFAGVTQMGQTNTATVNQIKGTTLVATIEQAQDRNNARDNNATIKQDGTDTPDVVVSTPNPTDYSNPYSPAPSSTTTTITGSASTLTADILQQGREGIAEIDQKGAGNNAYIKQVEDYSFQNEAYIKQDGKSNLADAQQFGGNQFVDIEQAAGTESGKIYVYQGIGSSFNPLAVNNPELFTNDNVATVKQLAGSNNYIYLAQNNQGNNAILTQESGNGNAITVVQYPQDPAFIQPGGLTLGNDPLKGNTVKITQKTGDGNVANVAQYGYENELTLTQDGSNNTLRKSAGAGFEFALQEGHGNTATLSQTGMGHTINLQQGGVGNIANVTQNN